MKTKYRILALVLLLALALGLAACGKAQEAPAQTPAPGAVVVPGSNEDADAAPEAAATPQPMVDGEFPDNAEKADASQYKKIAEGFVGANVEDLYAAIGYPDSVEDYVPSCLGPGEDGELHYDGFTVYTYRENGVETINAVL